MQLNEEYQREIDERCESNKSINGNLKAIDEINLRIDKLLKDMIQRKIDIELTRSKIVDDVTDKATKEMRLAFIRKARKDKEIELFQNEK